MDISARWNKNHIPDAEKQDMMLKRFPFYKRKLPREVGRALDSDVGNLSSSSNSAYVLFCRKPCGMSEEAKN